MGIVVAIILLLVVLYIAEMRKKNLKKIQRVEKKSEIKDLIK